MVYCEGSGCTHLGEPPQGSGVAARLRRSARCGKSCANGFGPPRRASMRIPARARAADLRMDAPTCECDPCMLGNSHLMGTTAICSQQTSCNFCNRLHAWRPYTRAVSVPKPRPRVHKDPRRDARTRRYGPCARRPQSITCDRSWRDLHLHLSSAILSSSTFQGRPIPQCSEASANAL